MHIGYFDEFGHIGPFVSRRHPKYGQHPVFGFGGLVLPAEKVREFGSFFHKLKCNTLAAELKASGIHPSHWEKKGSELLTTGSISAYPEIKPMINRLLNKILDLDGRVFFYGQVKPVGAPHEISETSQHRYDHTMIQTIIRTGYWLPESGRELMIFDQIDDRSRLNAMASAGGFIYSDLRGRKMIEPPMQVESNMYPSIQAADWICALISRLSAYRLGGPDWAEFVWADKYFSKRLDAVTMARSKIHDPLNSSNKLTKAELAKPIST